MFSDGVFVDSRETSSESVSLLLWEQCTETTHLGSNTDLKVDNTEGMDLFAILNTPYVEPKTIRNIHRYSWKSVDSSSSQTPISSDNFTTDIWSILSRNNLDSLFDQEVKTPISSQVYSNQNPSRTFEGSASSRMGNNENTPLENNPLDHNTLYAQLLSLEANEPPDHSDDINTTVRPFNFLIPSDLNVSVYDGTVDDALDFSPGSILIHEGHSSQVKKIGQISLKRSTYSNSKYIHQLVRRTVLNEWNNIRPRLKDDVVYIQESKNHILVWKPLSIYSAFTSNKIKIVDNIDVPSTSCFGKINMRNKRAWSRSPNKSKRMRL